MERTEIATIVEKPLKKQRKTNKISNFFNLLFLWFVKITSAPIVFLYLKLRLKGKKRAGKVNGKTIIVSNHVSTWDPVLLNYIFPSKHIHFMTADVMFTYNRLFSWFLRRLGAFPVNRFASDIKAISTTTQLLQQNKIVGIFPEGKRSLDGNLLQFRPGAVMAALNSDCPIVPVFINGNYGIFKRVTAAVGEKINLRDYCDTSHPSPEQLNELCSMLKQKVQDLANEVK